MNKDSGTAFAHSRKRDSATTEWQRLDEHLVNVALLAGDFAASFGNRDWAYLAGLWHDLGKFAPDWQEFLRTAGEDDAHRGRGPDHSTAGAIHAFQKMGSPGRILAYLIAGHHAGLPDWQSAEAGNAALVQRLTRRKDQERALIGNPPSALLNSDLPKSKPPSGADPAFWIRMLFSCLVDADFLDTERFMNPEGASKRGRYPPLEDLWASYESAMRDKVRAAPETPVNLERKRILERCLESADRPPGLFSLTVPTGGGKTLAATGFALKHALRHQKKRIIYVIPYTSIIEQTADVLREIFGEAVVEHHSNLDMDDPEKATTRNRLASENWDAPVIVTTTVQFFESLFAARPGRCRKLHNIAESVVILDEAQLLPVEFLNPILFSLRELTRHYKVTVLISTATLPAFEPRAGTDYSFDGLAGLTEIIDAPAELHVRMKRVNVHLPQNLQEAGSWEDMARELQEHRQVLCIVHRRSDCRALHRLMPPGTFHLSALMCGAHRSETIDAIKRSLREGSTTRVISTQLVEAGVDLDFPVVYRALAGLDSIAQAAGRCNREGALEHGDLHVFVPPTEPPPGVPRQGAGIARRLLANLTEDPLSLEMFQQYFRELFWIQGERLDAHNILEDLKPGGALEILFRTAALKFRLIDTNAYQAVVVRFGQGAKLIDRLRRERPDRWILRRLQRYIVNVSIRDCDHLLRTGELREIPDCRGLLVQDTEGLYDSKLGFLGSSQVTIYTPDELVV